MDLGASDVHTSGGAKLMDITSEKRKSLPASKFADPADRKYPIDTAARTRNAAARLEQNKASMSPEKYAQVRARIARAAKRFGVHSEYNKKATRKLRVHADLGEGGSLHVRHMKDGSAVCCGLGYVPLDKDAALADTPNRRVWIQLAKPGHYRGHRAGAFTLDTKTFDEIIRNFKASGQGRVQFDFEHASEMHPASGDIATTGAPAQGWIYDLARRPDGNLWALTEWLEPARTYIREDKYGSVSPAISFNVKDQVSGENVGARLSSAALTNDPFLTGMQRIAASAKAAGEGAPESDVALVENLENGMVWLCSATDTIVMRGAVCYSAAESMPAIHAALGTHALTPHADLMSRLDGLRDKLERAGGDHTKIVDGVTLSDHLLPLRSLANMHASASWPEIIDVIEELIDAAMDQHIEEMHGGESDADENEPDADDASMSAAAGAATIPEPQDTTTMADSNEVTALSAKCATLETEKKSIAGELHAAKAETVTLSAKVDESAKKIAELEKENAVLLSAKKARDEADIERDVDDAIARAGDKHDWFSKDNREALTMSRKNSPEAFAKSVAKLPKTSQAHLFSRTPGEPKAAQGSSLAGGTAVAMTATQLATKMSRDPQYANRDFEDLVDIAARQLSENPLGIAL
jgi:phage I-like protein